ncbi:AAA family ATPase [Thiothrix subterranea]|uniref:AAA family ATPase n=1 Tax=Thiothrix subterranea TaxID=2735563 RepID=UPI00192BBBDB|nr:AAA family ATPase [Thiothrix subterranea]QQZ27445.1 AAA family ATPase [Thiothrix subterranea]
MKLKLPYGISHYKTVIEEGYTYVDKTGWIQTLEDASRYNLIMRPRRFGKSLFVSMLAYYYDIKAKDDFNRLFGHLAAGQNPTGNQNRYQILFLEFSGISTDDPQSIYSAFNNKITLAIATFLKKYHYPAESLDRLYQLDSPTPADKLNYLLSLLDDQKIYLIIDEYDHFANALLAEDLHYFCKIMGKGGFVRAFYESIKAATQQGSIDRLIITGVTPIMLDSLTSGFNMVENLSLLPAFNEAIGLTQAETTSLIYPLTEQCAINADTLMATLKDWYNGYVFASKGQPMYNANMVLYFLKHVDAKNCAFPEEMLDENIASDYRNIMRMFSIGDRDTNYAVLEELISEGEVTAQQRRKFDFDKGFDREDFISLLCYMGFVSLAGSEFGVQRFRIPNHVIKRLYFAYFKVEIERKNQFSIPPQKLQQAVTALALHNDIEPLRHEIQSILMVLSNRDFMQMDEKHLKVLLVTLLYQSSIYFIKSEPEVNHKYPDILLLERSPYPVKHQHLIELKYCKKSERKKHPHLWDDKRTEGIQQVQGYQQLPDIQILEKLSCWVIVTDGEDVAAENVAFASQR